MDYETHNDTDIDICGTHLQGYVETTYTQLEKHFGAYQEGDYKTDWEWTIRFDDGTIARIYNWKNGPNYCGEAGFYLHEVKQWNIGGYKWDAVRLVQDVIDGTDVQRTTNAMDQMSEAMNPVEERRIAAAESAQWTRDNDPDWRY